MTTEEKIEVMKAYTKGKKIQIYFDGEWQDLDNPVWNWSSEEYRVKPTGEYYPYKDTDEMVEGFLKRFPPKNGMSEFAVPSIWVMNKKKTARLMVDQIRNKSVSLGGAFIGNNGLATLNVLFSDYTYLDGSPCGKKEEA